MEKCVIPGKNSLANFSKLMYTNISKEEKKAELTQFLERSIMLKQDVRIHFINRAGKYNRSSSWVDDMQLIKMIFDLSGASLESYVLDVAIGTGKIAREFKKKVKQVIGLDICIEMIEQGRGCCDRLVFGAAEKLPFKDNSFDICVCRQGLQFMHLNAAFEQMHRVLKPGGTIVLCHLAAYNEADKETTFYIQKLRNPARKNCFLPQDFPILLEKYHFHDIECFDYITIESVKQWIDNGAIDRQQMEKIITAYECAPGDFKQIHNITFRDRDIFDSMLMCLVKARKYQ